jgi:hypothetical protein
LHFSDELSREYFIGLTSETFDPKKNNFVCKKGARNESLDTLVYAYAAANHHELRLHLYPQAKWAELAAKYSQESSREFANLPVEKIEPPAPTPKHIVPTSQQNCLCADYQFWWRTLICAPARLRPAQSGNARTASVRCQRRAAGRALSPRKNHCLPDYSASVKIMSTTEQLGITKPELGNETNFPKKSYILAIFYDTYTS